MLGTSALFSYFYGPGDKPHGNQGEGGRTIKSGHLKNPAFLTFLLLFDHSFVS